MKRIGRADSAGGFTLIELMIVVAVFAFIVIAILSLLKTANDNLQVDIPSGALENDARRLVEQIERMVLSSNSTQVTVSSDGTSMQFMVPVDYDADGDVLDNSFEIELGGFEEGVPTLGHWMRYRFVQNGAPNDVYAEGATGNINVNVGKDFVRDDSYAMGSIVFDTQGGWTLPWGAGMVCLNAGDRDGDVDGDGVADRLFTLSGSTLTINIWMMRIVGDNEPIMVNARSSIQLRN